jgi:Family of unknown function (DUF6459)
MPTQQASLSHAQLTQDGTPHAERYADPPAGAESAGSGMSALRLMRVPDTGPPFDGELPADAIATSVGWPSDWGLADLGQPAPAPAGNRADGGTPPGTSTHAGAPTDAQLNGGPRDAGAPGRRTEEDWPRQFALLLAEVLAGARPLRQVLPWTTERARGHLDKLIPLFNGGQRPRVQRVITSRPTRDAIEMTVIVGVGTRTRAIAVRLERARRPRQGESLTGAAPPRLPAPSGQAMRPGTAAKTPPVWLCTDIEAA